MSAWFGHTIVPASRSTRRRANSAGSSSGWNTGPFRSRRRLTCFETPSSNTSRTEYGPQTFAETTTGMRSFGRRVTNRRLFERRDFDKLTPFPGKRPVPVELGTTHAAPLPHQTQGPWRQLAALHAAVECDCCLRAPVLGMEVRWPVLAEVHADDHAVELGDLRHEPKTSDPGRRFPGRRANRGRGQRGAPSAPLEMLVETHLARHADLVRADAALEEVRELL